MGIIKTREDKLVEQLNLVIYPQDLIKLRKEIARIAADSDRYNMDKRILIKEVVPAQEGTEWREGFREHQVSVDDVIEKSYLYRQLWPTLEVFGIRGGNKTEYLMLAKMFIKNRLLQTKDADVMRWFAHKAIQMERFYSIYSA